MDYHTQISLRRSRNNTYSVNGEGCSKKYRKPYFIIGMTINKHCSITVKPVLKATSTAMSTEIATEIASVIA